MQPLLYALIFAGDDVKHCTKFANAPFAIGIKSVGNDVKLLWYVGEDDKYWLHTKQALKCVNATHFAKPIYSCGGKTYGASAIVSDDDNYRWQAPRKPERCAP